MPEEEAIAVKGSVVLNVSSSKEGGAQERCSAFIAVGDWTSDGKIVCAHNNFSNFIDGQLAKYVVDLKPTKGNRIMMMGFPGWIWSGTDFFVTAKGIIVAGRPITDPRGIGTDCCQWTDGHSGDP